MPEAPGRGEGETADDGKLTWAADREPSPASASGFRPAPAGLGAIRLQGLRNGRSSSHSLIKAPKIGFRRDRREAVFQFWISQIMLQRMSLLMARNGSDELSNECLMLGVKQTSKIKVVTSACDPHVWSGRA
jgi:hypothetical protein